MTLDCLLWALGAVALALPRGGHLDNEPPSIRHSGLREGISRLRLVSTRGGAACTALRAWCLLQGRRISTRRLLQACLGITPGGQSLPLLAEAAGALGLKVRLQALADPATLPLPFLGAANDEEERPRFFVTEQVGPGWLRVVADDGAPYVACRTGFPTWAAGPAVIVPENVTPCARGALRFDREVVDLGRVWPQTQEVTFRWVNTGSKPVRIHSCRAPQECRTSIPDEPTLPGQEGSLSVCFTPRRRYRDCGTPSWVHLLLKKDGATRPVMLLSVLALAVPPPTASPEAIRLTAARPGPWAREVLIHCPYGTEPVGIRLSSRRLQAALVGCREAEEGRGIIHQLQVSGQEAPAGEEWVAVLTNDPTAPEVRVTVGRATGRGPRSAPAPRP